ARDAGAGSRSEATSTAPPSSTPMPSVWTRRTATCTSMQGRRWRKGEWFRTEAHLRGRGQRWASQASVASALRRARRMTRRSSSISARNCVRNARSSGSISRPSMIIDFPPCFINLLRQTIVVLRHLGERAQDLGGALGPRRGAARLAQPARGLHPPFVLLQRDARHAVHVAASEEIAQRPVTTETMVRI